MSAASEAETFHKIHPREFHKKFFEQGVRPDGRALSAVRKTVITHDTVSSCDSSSFVKFGNTTVIAGVKLEVAAPLGNRPKDGKLVVNVHLTPLCGPQFSIGRPTDAVISMGESITNALVRSGALSLSQLCIEEGKSVWVLYMDIVCLDYDGNAYDAALISAVNALRHLRLPRTAPDNENEGQLVIVDTPPYSQGHLVTLSHCPIPLSFGLVDQFVLADPNAQEEVLLDSSFTLIFNEKFQLCSVYKPGAGALDDRVLVECMKVAKKRAAEVAGMV